LVVEDGRGNGRIQKHDRLPELQAGEEAEDRHDISETNTMIMMEELGLQDSEETEGYSDFENQFQQGPLDS
jgi:hypothetical protein